MTGRTRIDFTAMENITALNLAAYGFSYSLIASRTGLSNGQISYRLKKTAVKVTEYRRGETPVSKAVIAATKEVTDRYIASKLRPLFTKPKEAA